MTVGKYRNKPFIPFNCEGLQQAYLVPKVESSRDGHHGEEDASHDKEADLDVCEQEEREEEDTDEAEAHVAPQLKPDYPVCLPRDVHGAVREGVRRQPSVLEFQCIM